jgi:hypothetical protein
MLAAGGVAVAGTAVINACLTAGGYPVADNCATPKASAPATALHT